MGLDATREPQHAAARREGEEGEQYVEHAPSVASRTHVVHTGGVPEILEVEMYRRSAEAVVGRRVRAVEADDPIVCPEGPTFGAVVGKSVVGLSRRGKTMTIAFSGGLSLDVHFGMSGRLVVDGASAIDSLVYGASDDRRWARFGLTFAKGSMVLSDPRRFARVSWHRGGEGLGPDAFTVSLDELVAGFTGRRAPVKAVLLDQSTVAGLGNMLVDEILWRADIAPHRTAGELAVSEMRRIHRTTMAVLPELLRKGGSHAGRLAAELRVSGSACPRDGATLARTVCGGRTTFHCPVHQV